MPVYLRTFLACFVLVMVVGWAMRIAGTDVEIDGVIYGDSWQVATVGVDTCGCEASPEPDPNESTAVSLARDQLRPLVFPLGLGLVSMGYLVRRYRASVRVSGRPFQRADRPRVGAR